MNEKPNITLQTALQAQSALRARAGLEPELFPVNEFVGMISDEIEQLRNMGQSDEEIADLVRSSSPIHVSADDISQYYAPLEARNAFKGGE